MATPAYTTEEKKMIIEECMASGLSRAEFCRRKGINDSTFDGWLNRFYPDREKKKQEKSSGLVRIQPAGQETGIVMEYCGARIRFSQSALKEVLKALSAISG